MEGGWTILQVGDPHFAPERKHVWALGHGGDDRVQCGICGTAIWESNAWFPWGKAVLLGPKFVCVDCMPMLREEAAAHGVKMVDVDLGPGGCEGSVKESPGGQP